MSWRSIQLNNQSCDQDDLIVSLFIGDDVKYIGKDKEFEKKLNINPDSTNLILVVNTPCWTSDVEQIINKNLVNVDKFYIGINRYFLLGNDTCYYFNSSDQKGLSLIKVLEFYLDKQGYSIDRYGHLDNDLGRYFNFVQPLTWVYGSKKTNRSN